MITPANLCVMVYERRPDGSIWPVFTVEMPESTLAKVTGAKAAGIAVPTLKRALQVAEARVTLDTEAVRQAMLLLPPTAPEAENNDDKL